MTVGLNLAKLLLRKWTTTTPRNQEKHFIVTLLIQPDPLALAIGFIELEAAYTRRSVTLRWRALLDSSPWQQGWR